MHRYFFNISDDSEYIADRQGVELSGIEEARSELRSLLTLLPERLRRPGARVLVMDASGTIVAEEWVTAPGTQERHNDGPLSARLVAAPMTLRPVN
jgi:hypothetical protein